PHSQPAAAAVRAETLTVELEAHPRVIETVSDSGGGVSLRDAKVVVSGGRGGGPAGGVALHEGVPALVGRARGRLAAGPRRGGRGRKRDQVGQTGTKISADLYVACGISGATQHIAGAKGAKKILAINSDPEAPILSVADYAVIGDLHEIVPAISAELRRVRGTSAQCSSPSRSPLSVRARGGAPRSSPRRSAPRARTTVRPTCPCA